MARTSNMTSILAATILSLAAVVHAAPLASSSVSASSTSTSTYVNPGNVIATSTPTASPAPAPVPAKGQSGSDAPIATFYPDFTSQYNSRTGAVDFHTPQGLVSRSPANGGADISTLVTFQIPNTYSANTCQLVFDLTAPSSSVSGTAKAQLFTSLAPAYADSESWPSGNLRNQNLGTVNVVKGGRATWEAGSGPGATVDGVFPCKEITGQIFGGEVVPQGDYDLISWASGLDGVKILVF